MHHARVEVRIPRQQKGRDARRKRRHKRGGGRQRQELHADLAVMPEGDDNLLALDPALEAFAGQYPVQAEVVKLRFFAGMTGDAVAELLELSPSTVDRHWVFAKAWLRRELGGGGRSQKVS